MSTSQPTLFDNDLRRVSSRIAQSILAFCSSHSTFHAPELLEYVEREVGPVAPDSPQRILRSLKQAGRISYTVLNRRQSLYSVNNA